MVSPQRSRAARRRAESGFTLMEVMIAFAILVVGILGVLSLQHMGIVHTALSGELTLASNLAATTIEDLRVQDFDSIDADEQYYDKRAQPVSGFGYFKVTTEVTPSGNFKDVKVNVTWTFDKHDRVHDVELNSRIFSDDAT